MLTILDFVCVVFGQVLKILDPFFKLSIHFILHLYQIFPLFVLLQLQKIDVVLKFGVFFLLASVLDADFGEFKLVIVQGALQA